MAQYRKGSDHRSSPPGSESDQVEYYEEIYEVSSSAESEGDSVNHRRPHGVLQVFHAKPRAIAAPAKHSSHSPDSNYTSGGQKWFRIGSKKYYYERRDGGIHKIWMPKKTPKSKEQRIEPFRNSANGEAEDEAIRQERKQLLQRLSELDVIDERRRRQRQTAKGKQNEKYQHTMSAEAKPRYQLGYKDCDTRDAYNFSN